MTDFFELAQKRESCRKYAKRPVEREKIVACLEAARLAPSACNSQPWHYFVADDSVLTSQIAGSVQGFGMNRFADEEGNLLFEIQEIQTRAAWTEYMKEGNRLAEPEDYIIVK